MTEVKILTDSVAHLRQMDFRYGSGQIRDTAVQLLHQAATTLLHSSYSDSTWLSFYTEAELAQLQPHSQPHPGAPAADPANALS